MLKDESFFYFYEKLCDIANESFSLGKNFSNKKLVRKTVRSLFNRFQQKLLPLRKVKI